jgi:hypothetical protein
MNSEILIYQNTSGVPTTKAGVERKLGNAILRFLFGRK